MGNVVKDIIDDISLRLGDPANNGFRRPVILRAMKLVYRRTNEKYRGLVSREVEYTFSTVDVDAGTNYKTKPIDIIVPYKVNPKHDWREPNVFMNDEAHTYTIDLGYIYFAQATAVPTYKVRYYSYGWILVELEDGAVAFGEVNTPEWDENFYDYLIKATCMELSSNYPQIKMDIAELPAMRAALLRHVSSKQATAIPYWGGNRSVETQTIVPYREEGF